MLFEMEVDTLAVGGVREFEERVAAAVREGMEISALVGFFHSEIGDLNRVLHIWKYEGPADRARIRGTLAAQPGWPPADPPLVRAQATKLLTGAPFRPEPLLGALGPVYEFRTYTIKPRRMDDILALWARNLASREALSPLAACFTTEAGPLNEFIHVWAYRDLNHRAEVRAASRGLRNWHLGREFMLSQRAEIWMPAAFSPMH